MVAQAHPAATKTPASNEMAKDPVCGMVIAKATALKAERNGRTYYFCSPNCLRTFESPGERTQVLTPQRLNAFVFSAFGGIALLIAVVGVAGVLAFSVGARTREFGIRLAVGCEPRQLRAGVLREGAAIAAAGILVGGLGGIALAWVASRLFGVAQMPGLLPIAGAAALLAAAAILASLLPAVRASRVDVIQALRSE